MRERGRAVVGGLPSIVMPPRLLRFRVFGPLENKKTTIKCDIQVPLPHQTANPKHGFYLLSAPKRFIASHFRSISPHFDGFPFSQSLAGVLIEWGVVRKAQGKARRSACSSSSRDDWLEACLPCKRPSADVARPETHRNPRDGNPCQENWTPLELDFETITDSSRRRIPLFLKWLLA